MRPNVPLLVGTWAGMQLEGRLARPGSPRTYRNFSLIHILRLGRLHTDPSSLSRGFGTSIMTISPPSQNAKGKPPRSGRVGGEPVDPIALELIFLWTRRVKSTLMCGFEFWPHGITGL